MRLIIRPIVERKKLIHFIYPDQFDMFNVH